MSNVILGFAIAGVAMIWVVFASEAARRTVARVVRLPLVRPRIGFAMVPDDGPIAKRLSVIAVGPIAAYAALAVVAFGHFRCNTFTGPSTNVVARIVDGSDALGKLVAGDRIVEVDGEPFVDGGAAELSKRVNAREGVAIAIVVERDGTRRTFTVQPRGVTGRWVLGVALANDEVHHGTGEALALALEYPWEQAATALRGFAGRLVPADEPDPGGPVRVVEEFRTVRTFGVAALEAALLFSTYTLLVIALIDLVRGLVMVSATIRRGRTRGGATSGP